MSKRKKPGTQQPVPVEKRRGRPPKLMPYACPRDGHDDYEVRSRGKRSRADGTPMLMLKCVAPDGRTHTFEVDSSQDATVVVKLERCHVHPAGKITLYGTYGDNGHPRQRYQCVSTNPTHTHVFTPSVPRQQVCSDENCDECAQVRGVNAGDFVAGRGRRYTAKQVADGLIQLSRGSSYASVGEWARRQRADDARKALLASRTRGEAAANAVSEPSLKHAETWQVAASWLETYTDVLWQPWEAEQIARAHADQDNPEMPRVVVIDDKPFFGNAVRTADGRKAELFSVIALIEVELFGMQRANRVRLLRALPQHGATDYALVLHELGYIPDIIVSDGSHAARNVIKELRRESGKDIVWAISQHHIKNQMSRMLTNLARRVPGFTCPRGLSDDVGEFGGNLLRGTTEWKKWWDGLDRALTNQNVPAHQCPTKWRNDYYDEVLTALEWWEQYPNCPRTTGKVEQVLADEVEPLLEGRYERMTNLARTNFLLNLLTLRLNHQLDNVATVAGKLHQDLRKNSGFAAPSRTMNDPGAYRSLYDHTLSERLLAQWKAKEEQP